MSTNPNDYRLESLAKSLGLTLEEVAQKMGRNRDVLFKRVWKGDFKILELPDYVIYAIETGKFSVRGWAATLLANYYSMLDGKRKF